MQREIVLLFMFHLEKSLPQLLLSYRNSLKEFGVIDQ